MDTGTRWAIVRRSQRVGHNWSGSTHVCAGMVSGARWVLQTIYCLTFTCHGPMASLKDRSHCLLVFHVLIACMFATSGYYLLTPPEDFAFLLHPVCFAPRTLVFFRRKNSCLLQKSQVSYLILRDMEGPYME